MILESVKHHPAVGWSPQQSQLQVIGDLTHHKKNYMPADMKMFVVTAKSQRSLLRMIKNLGDWASERSWEKQPNLDDVACTLAYRRLILPWRRTFVASRHEDLIFALIKPIIKVSKATTDVQIGYLFTGQGAQLKSKEESSFPALQYLE